MPGKIVSPFDLRKSWRQYEEEDHQGKLGAPLPLLRGEADREDEGVVRAGALQMQGENAKIWKLGKKGWKDVWAVLKDDGNLKYYSSRQKSLNGEEMGSVNMVLSGLRTYDLYSTDESPTTAGPLGGAVLTNSSTDGPSHPQVTAAATTTTRSGSFIGSPGSPTAVLTSSGNHIPSRRTSSLVSASNNANSSSDPSAGFEVIAATRHYVFAAETAQDRDEWMSAITTVKQRMMDVLLKNTLSTSSSPSAADSDSTIPATNDASGVDAAVEEGKSEMRRLLSIPGNDLCADCAAPQPEWASLSLGVFICIECSGVHRGMHLNGGPSKIRSLALDVWDESMIKFMEGMGNDKANTEWGARLPADHRPPTTLKERVEFIKHKYELKRFCASAATN